MLQMNIYFSNFPKKVFATSLDGEEGDARHDDGSLEEPGRLECLGQSQDAGTDEGDEDVGHHAAFWVRRSPEAAHLARHRGSGWCGVTEGR